MNRRHFLTSLAAVTTASASARPADAIKIVSCLPRMGSAKGQTDAIVNGIRLAVKEYGDAIGFAIEILDWDDSDPVSGTWTAEKEATLAKRAIEEKDVMGWIGPYNSGAAMVSMPLLNRAGLVQISPACTYIGLTRKVDEPQDVPGRFRPSGKITFFRVCPHDESQAPLSAQFARDELKIKSAYILDDKDLYGQGMAGLFAAECKRLKVEVLGRESIDILKPGYADVMKRVARAEPNLLYFGGTTQSRGGQIAKDMTAAGLKCPLMVPDGCYEPAFIASAGAENLKNCYCTMPGFDTPGLKGEGAEFVKRYKAAFRVEPEIYSVYGYESARVLLAAIKKAGKKDREAIRKAVLATKDFEGALGKWSFDENGDTTLQCLTISQVKDGKFVPVKVIIQK